MKYLFVFVLMAALTLASIAFARPMQEKGIAFPVPGGAIFCLSSPLCSPRGQQTLVYTPGLLVTLDAVNRAVNRSIAPRSDIGDIWRVYPSRGDCEDYALTKKAELIKKGFPSRALLITIVTAYGQGHAVLTVRTTKGDLILDNMTNKIKDWQQTGFKYHQRQSQNGRGWVRIG